MSGRRLRTGATPGRPPKLDIKRIRQAAVEICQTENLEAVTLNSVAKTLDVTPMALYRYVASSSELPDLVVEQMAAAFPLPEPPTPGNERAWLVQVATDRYHHLLEYPGVAAYLLTRGPTGDAGFDYMERLSSVLSTAGIPDDDLWNAYILIVMTICTHAAQQTALDNRLQNNPHQGTTSDVAPAFTENRPTLTRMMPHMARDPETAFQFNLTTVLDGLLDA